MALSNLFQQALPLAGGAMFSIPEERVQPKQAAILSQVESIDLNLPLFNWRGEVALQLDVELQHAETEVSALHYMEDLAEETEDDTPVVWTDSEVARLHGNLLEESLKTLAGRGNSNQKHDVLQWVFQPDVIGLVRGKAVYTKDIPFTFAFCCRLEGMNPDAIRDFIASRLSSSSRTSVAH